MTQLGSISNANPNTTNITTDNIIKNTDDSFENIIDAGLKKNIENETSMEKMEKLGGPSAPKPESTMHKVGRFLTGILGGLLLAAGVAAAVAATVATCGLAGGVIAGVAATVVGTVGGTAATAVIAGAAGSAGIALITGSHVMKPRNPEALLQTQQAAKQEPAEKGVALTAMGGDEAETIAEALKTNHGIDVTEFNDADNLYVKSLRDNGMGFLLTKNISLKGDDTYGTVSKYAKDNVVQFVSNALTVFGVDSEKAQSTPKNVLLVRYAIDNYLRTQSAILDDDALNVLNDDAVKKDLNDMIESEMSFMPVKNTESYHMLAIFRDALNLKSVPKPQQNPAGGTGTVPNQINVDDLLKGTGGLIPKTTSFQQNPVQYDTGQPAKILKDIQKIDNNIKTVVGNDEKLTGLLNTITLSGNYTYMSTVTLCEFTESVLKGNGIGTYEFNEKNVLLVRHAIVNYFKGNPTAFPDMPKTLGDAGNQKQISQFLVKEALEYSPTMKYSKEEYEALVAIFRVAISGYDPSTLNINSTSMPLKA